MINFKKNIANFIRRKIYNIFFEFDYRIFEELSLSRLNDRIYSKIPILTSFPQIDISIVTFNSEKWINLFFKSLLEQKYPLNMINVYIVDNSSTDNTLAALKKYFEDKIDIFNNVNITSQQNLGFGTGNDTAINLGTSRYILVVNIDGEFKEDSILNIVTIAENDNIDVASWELRQKPYEHPKYYDPVTLETSWSSHAAILIRREAYIKVKGYEKRIFMYGEDVELSYKFRDAGYKLKYCPNAVFTHHSYEKTFFKPIQHNNSMLANIFLRARYGNFFQIIHIPILYMLFLMRSTEYKDSKVHKNNIFFILNNLKFYFSTRRKSKSIIFDFANFNYSINREGAFITSKDILYSPLISVIMRSMPNRSFDLTKQSVMTIANQTYKNIELIFVEDGGNVHENNLTKLCEDLLINFKYVSSKKVGRSEAGNLGLSLTSGEYLMFLDDDDYLFADHIETIMSNLLPVKDKYAAAYTLAFQAIIDKRSKIFSCKDLYVIEILKQQYSYDKLKIHNLFPIQSIIFKKSLFVDRGGFDTTIDYLEDWNLWCRYGYENQFLYIPKTTSIYTITHNSKDRFKRSKQMKAAHKIVKYKTKTDVERLNFKNNIL